MGMGMGMGATFARHLRAPSHGVTRAPSLLGSSASTFGPGWTQQQLEANCSGNKVLREVKMLTVAVLLGLALVWRSHAGAGRIALHCSPPRACCAAAAASLKPAAR